jgi:uncharacterized protein YyaL (SSP411 family)
VAWALFKLHAVTAEQQYIDTLEKVLRAHYASMLQRPTTLALLVQVLWSYLGNHHVITVPSNLATTETISALVKIPAVNRTIVVSPSSAGKITTCTGTYCRLAESVDEVRSILERIS